MGTQFSLHKISYDPEGYKNWSDDVKKEKKKMFHGILEKIVG